MKFFSSFFKSQHKTAEPFANANTPSLSMLPCLGAIIGDTVGSVYEFDNIKTTTFPLFQELSHPTDDSGYSDAEKQAEEIQNEIDEQRRQEYKSLLKEYLENYNNDNEQ